MKRPRTTFNFHALANGRWPGPGVYGPILSLRRNFLVKTGSAGSQTKPFLTDSSNQSVIPRCLNSNAVFLSGAVGRASLSRKGGIPGKKRTAVINVFFWGANEKKGISMPKGKNIAFFSFLAAGIINFYILAVYSKRKRNQRRPQKRMGRDRGDSRSKKANRAWFGAVLGYFLEGHFAENRGGKRGL